MNVFICRRYYKEAWWPARAIVQEALDKRFEVCIKNDKSGGICGIMEIKCNKSLVRIGL